LPALIKHDDARKPGEMIEEVSVAILTSTRKNRRLPAAILKVANGRILGIPKSAEK
jgi:hypothetical protein